MERPPHGILHIPHASRAIPQDLRETILLGDEALEEELLRMTDAYTDLLFEQERGDAVAIRHPVSRLVVDPERFPDDLGEPMAGRGMGAIYTRTSTLEPLRDPPPPAERRALLERFYHPHHAALTAAVSVSLAGHGSALILDCHSFPACPLPYESDQRLDRPDICLGTDAFHTPPWLVAEGERRFREAGFAVEIDRPFAGALVPAGFYRNDSRVYALMIEMNRSLYMHEENGRRTAGFEDIAARVRRVCREIMAIAKRKG